MREKYKMQAGGVLLSEIAACRNSSGGSHKRLAVLDDQALNLRMILTTSCRTVAIPFINEIAFPDGVATVCKWGYYSANMIPRYCDREAQDYNHIRQSGL